MKSKKITKKSIMKYNAYINYLYIVSCIYRDKFTLFGDY